MSAFSAASFSVALVLALAVAATAAAQDAPALPSADRLPVEVSTFLAVGDSDGSGTGVTAVLPRGRAGGPDVSPRACPSRRA